MEVANLETNLSAASPIHVELNFESAISSTLFRTWGNITLFSENSISYIFLNATLWDGDMLVECTKYMMIDVEPELKYSFDISENKWLNLEDRNLWNTDNTYNCLLEVQGPNEIIAIEKINCSICKDEQKVMTKPYSLSIAEQKSNERYAEFPIYIVRMPEGDYIEMAEYDEKFADELDTGYKSQISNQGENSELMSGNPSLKEEIDFSEEFAKESMGMSSIRAYVGSTTSNKYHRPDCRYAMKIQPEKRIWFTDALDAKSQGYIPCKVCNPQ